MSSSNTMVRTEFAAAIKQIANDRNISEESILEAIRQALVSAYRKQFGEFDDDRYYYVELNEENGEAQIFECPVTERDEETNEILAWDDSQSKDVTPAGFGRIAAQTAKQVILQKIRESEKDQILADYSERIGEIVTAQILRMQGRTVILDIGRGQGFMPPEEQMRGEFYRINARITVLIKEIQDTQRGRRIVVSRSDARLVEKLFEREVPEMASGAVEIAMIAREAGVRTKLAVRSTQEGVDPVGSCVGQRGVRVQEVIRELNNEKLDIIPHAEEDRLMIQGALAPAEGLAIEVDEENRVAVVTSPDDQLSLAIGRGGQNVRLAAKLTGYGIKIKSAAGDLQSQATGDEEYEIDTFENLEPETREYLVEFKLTTLMDLSRFRNKWEDAEEISDEQKAMLEELVKKFDEEMAQNEDVDMSGNDRRPRKPAETDAPTTQEEQKAEVATENAEESAESVEENEQEGAESKEPEQQEAQEGESN